MPDFDAIASVWLLKRFYFQDESTVKYVNTGNPDSTLLNKATAVVDTGRILNEDTLRFDHHQYPDNTICATSLVFDYLLDKGVDIGYLTPLVELITWGDTGNPNADMSRNLGIHAQLSAFRNNILKDTYLSSDDRDDHILRYGFSLLDTIEEHLHNQKMARENLENHIVYHGEFVIGLHNAAQGMSQIAAELYNVPIVVFINDENPETTISVGAMRFNESEIHIGNLVEGIDTFQQELCMWFKHPVGFFAGRGTMKAPNSTSFPLQDFINLCQEINNKVK
jgi:hypothetical protein